MGSELLRDEMSSVVVTRLRGTTADWFVALYLLTANGGGHGNRKGMVGKRGITRKRRKEEKKESREVKMKRN